MSDFNNVILMGRLVRAPAMRFAPTGTAVAAFCVAANHRRQSANREWTDERAFVPCVAFARTAEQLAQKQKGDNLVVVGRLRTESWQEDGAARSRLVMVAEQVQIIPSGPKANDLTGKTEPESTSDGDQQTPPF
jgi:single-strand DNA-binding protein